MFRFLSAPTDPPLALSGTSTPPGIGRKRCWPCAATRQVQASIDGSALTQEAHGRRIGDS